MSISEVIQGEVQYLNKLASNPATPPAMRELLELKAMMLLERASHHEAGSQTSKPAFKESFTKRYLIACVGHRPGLTRVEHKEFAGIPGSPKRSETDTFRDYLISIRKDIHIDEYGKCWPRNGLEVPVARIGNVVLDGRITPMIKKALVFLRDYPGTTQDDLRARLNIKSSKRFQELMASLSSKTVSDSAGRMFVDGYIPTPNTQKLPEKSTPRAAKDPLMNQLLDQMDRGNSYDWSELVGFYREREITAKEGYRHINSMVLSGFLRTKNGKFARAA